MFVPSKPRKFPIAFLDELLETCWLVVNHSESPKGRQLNGRFSKPCTAERLQLKHWIFRKQNETSQGKWTMFSPTISLSLSCIVTFPRKYHGCVLVLFIFCPQIGAKDSPRDEPSWWYLSFDSGHHVKVIWGPWGSRCSWIPWNGLFK